MTRTDLLTRIAERHDECGSIADEPIVLDLNRGLLDASKNPPISELAALQPEPKYTGSCEFCPYHGGGCIVCDSWDDEPTQVTAPTAKGPRG